jgi:hypothetical protein
MFAKIDKNGIVTVWPIFEGQMEKENPSFKFPLDVNEEYNLENNGKIIPDGYVRVKLQGPDFGDKKSYLYEITEGLPELINGEYTQTWNLKPHSLEKLEQYKEQLALAVREERNRLLQDSDNKVFVDLWEKMSDVEKEQISIYRQALRDLSEQEGFPISVEWPLEPSTFIVREV